jgi:hypothetical protein
MKITVIESKGFCVVSLEVGPSDPYTIEEVERVVGVDFPYTVTDSKDPFTGETTPSLDLAHGLVDRINELMGEAIIPDSKRIGV